MCKRGIRQGGIREQGSSGSVPPDARAFLQCQLPQATEPTPCTLLGLLNGVRWLAGGWIAQVTLILGAQGEQVVEPRDRTRCRLSVLEQILGSG